jgi:hypothetical protein
MIDVFFFNKKEKQVTNFTDEIGGFERLIADLLSNVYLHCC